MTSCFCLIPTAQWADGPSSYILNIDTRPPQQCRKHVLKAASLFNQFDLICLIFRYNIPNLPAQSACRLQQTHASLSNCV